jgi:hypothetical protein
MSLNSPILDRIAANSPSLRRDEPAGDANVRQRLHPAINRRSMCVNVCQLADIRTTFDESDCR